MNANNALLSNAIDALAEHGATFILAYPRSKKPIGDDWTNRPHNADAARAHDGNVGLLCGQHSAGIILLDVDQAAQDFAIAYPELTRWAFWRDNARDRAKFAVRIVSGQLRSRKSPGLEILADGSQGIIAGIHETGAQIHFEQDGPLPSVTADEIIAVFEEWTGEEYHAAAVDEFEDIPLTADSEELLSAAIERIEPGRRNAIGYGLACRLRDGGISKAEAHAAIDDYQVAAEHAGDHPYTAQEAHASVESAYRRPPSQNAAYAHIEAVERGVVAGRIEVSANRQKTLFGILAVMREAGRTRDVAISVREIVKRSGVAIGTVVNHLDDLIEAGIIERSKRAHGVYSAQYTLLAAACDRIEHYNKDSSSSGSEQVQLGGSASPSVLVFNSDAATDNHANVASNYHALQGEAICAIRARVHPELAEDDDEARLSVFGAVVQRILSVLQVRTVDSVLELAEAIHMSRRTVERRLATLRRHGIVDGLELADDWRDIVAKLSPRLTTYGADVKRSLYYEKQREAYQKRMQRFTRGEALEVAIQAAERAKERIEALSREHNNLTKHRRSLGITIPIGHTGREPKRKRMKAVRALRRPGLVSKLATDAERQHVQDAALLAELRSLRLQAHGGAIMATT